MISSDRLDKNGWDKTRVGRIVYDRPTHALTEIDLKRMAKKFITEGPLENRVPRWLEVVAEIFEEVIVDKFAALPFVDDLWELMRDYTFHEYAIGRPMSLAEQFQWIIEYLRRDQDQKENGKSRIDTSLNLFIEEIRP